VANAVSFVLSASGIRAIGGDEPHPARATGARGAARGLALHPRQPVTNNATVAVMTACGGLLGAVASPRAAIALAGALLLMTPLLLPRRAPAPRAAPATAS
jgi:hypothetical protein